MARFVKIDPKQIERAEENTRVVAAPINDLVESVKAIGKIIEPVVVLDVGAGKYLTFVGWRRVEAARQAGIKEIPAIVYNKNELDATTRRVWSLTENFERTDLHEADLENTIKELVHDIGNADLVASAMGWPVGRVRRYLGLEELPSEVKKMSDEGRLTTKDALRLVDLIGDRDDKEITELAEYITGIKEKGLRKKIPGLAKRGIPVPVIKTKIKTLHDIKKFRRRLPLYIDIKMYDALGKAATDLKATDIPDTAERILDLWLGEHGYYS